MKLLTTRTMLIKRKSKTIILTVVLLVAIFTSICLIVYHPIKQPNKRNADIVQYDTLFFISKNTANNHLKYLLLEYKTSSSNMNISHVRKSYISYNGEADFYNYCLINKGDSLAIVKSISDEIYCKDSTYIDLSTKQSAYVDCERSRLYSVLQFIGYEHSNSKKDSLIVMYGWDISGIPNEINEEKFFFYFDRKFHLRKVMSKRQVLFIDKHYFERF